MRGTRATVAMGETGPVQPCFTFDHVSVGPHGARILDDVTCAFPDGGVTVISGPSGSGKSTLLRLCNRLEVPSSGVVRFRGEDVAGLDPVALRRRVGMVFQRPTPFPGTGFDNLCVAAGLDRPAATELLRRVGLEEEFLDRDALALSGGEAQRLCLARTLATGCDVLLADECTSALDPDATAVLEGLARGLADDGTTVLWVTHDVAQGDRLADRRLAVDAGRIVPDATDGPGARGPG
jgi:putative ABC transport system ATP-binding protein